MKKFFGLLLAAVMTFSLVACGAQNVPSDNTSDDYPSGPITCRRRLRCPYAHHHEVHLLAQ